MLQSPHRAMRNIDPPPPRLDHRHNIRLHRISHHHGPRRTIALHRKDALINRAPLVGNDLYTAASIVLFAVATLAALTVTLLTRQSGALGSIPFVPKHTLLAGLFVAFYVLSITWIAPKFGIGNAVFFVLLGQLVSASVIDHFGLFGARLTPFTLTRGLGVALMAAGVFVTQKV